MEPSWKCSEVPLFFRHFFSGAVARPVFGFLRCLLETCLYPCARREGSGAGIWLLGFSLSESRRVLLCSWATLAPGVSRGCRAGRGSGKAPWASRGEGTGQSKMYVGFFVCVLSSWPIYFISAFLIFRWKSLTKTKMDGWIWMTWQGRL